MLMLLLLLLLALLLLLPLLLLLLASLRQSTWRLMWQLLASHSHCPTVQYWPLQQQQ
jgi:hypothetical protein